MQFFKHCKFHITIAIRVIDQAPAGLLLVTFSDVQYPVCSSQQRYEIDGFFDNSLLRVSTSHSLELTAVFRVLVEIALHL
jgi:hypothetical protein